MVDARMHTGLLAADGRVRSTLRRLPQGAVERGLSPRWLGYRWVARETLREYFARRASVKGADGAARRGERHEVVHPAAIASNPLPCNVAARAELPAERGWWGFSFRDAPERASGETSLATLSDCRLAFYRDAGGTFHVGVLTADETALSMREVAFRPGHGRALRSGASPARLERAIWILERSYDNYSHWLTSHLSKLCLLRERGLLQDVVLPPSPGGFLGSSLRRLGLDPRDFPTFDPTRPLEVGELTLLGTDRFRPELLRPVRAALTPVASPSGGRRIFISRARSARRRLVDEERLWPRFAAAGFERVSMETLSFEDQVRLMSETRVLCGPHGAGLTNMMLCPAGTHVVELADLDFPNPNVYALACAMGHPYWLVRARSVGDGHPLERDMTVSEEDVAAVLEELPR